MSHFTISSSSMASVQRAGRPVYSALEDRLLGLSSDELLRLYELVVNRLPGRSLLAMKAESFTADDTKLQRLTSRENEVLTLIASGYTRPEVAKTLKISRNTAAKHVSNIYRKLEIESIAEATMLAVRGGIVC